MLEGEMLESVVSLIEESAGVILRLIRLGPGRVAAGKVSVDFFFSDILDEYISRLR